MSEAVASARQALAVRILLFWGDMRGSMRSLLDEEPGQGRLIFHAMLSGLVVFLGAVAGLWLDPATATIPPDELTARVAAAFIGAMFFRTLALYGVAGIAGLAARAAGGVGGGRDTRAAVFWAALAAAPLGFVATLAYGFLDLPGDAAPMLLKSLAPVGFAVALSPCLAEAHGFRRASVVFGCVGLGALGVVAAAWLAGGA